MKKGNVQKKVHLITDNDLEKHSERFVQFYGMPIPKLLEKYLKLNKYKTIVDCGCGDGILLEALKRKGYLSGKKVIAIDMSLRRLSNVKKLDKTFDTRVDSAETLESLKNNSVDFLISTQVIEHVDDKRMLKAITRVVKKRGTVYLTTVFKKWYGWYFYRRDGKWVMDTTHQREYTKEKQLIDLINRKSFEVIEMNKCLIWFPMMDFFIRKLSVKNSSFFVNNFLFRHARELKVPILGYYDWQLILRKK